MLSRSASALSRTACLPRAPQRLAQRFASTKSLRETLQEVIPAKQEQLKKLKAEHSQAVLGEVKVENVIGGMRGLKAMLWEASVLDPIEGIRFHGLSIPDCQKVLPPAPGGKEIIPESMLWLLLTGQVPTPEQTAGLSREFAEKGELPKFIEELIDSFPKTLHPMTQLGMAVAALNHDKYWTHTLEDCINLIARLPALAARIYRNVYNPGAELPAINKDLDLETIPIFSVMATTRVWTEYLRLYIALHGDHEGGNASAHTAHLVGSTLSDPYLSYSAALFALAGPLHGLANQEVLRWQLSMQKELGNDITHERIKEYLWEDSQERSSCSRVMDTVFCAILTHGSSPSKSSAETRPELKSSPIIDLVNKTFQVAPDVLKEHGKTKNPYPKR
ncbi:citrate synthase-like protein [Gymnopilus junonius]|uniref:Citrate synthase n=1 Tax=Gymnopilus junonius TaxID=109634 RepID=A0A9P5NQE6_GYMJU|nr:citrate synthase-like protein [Gymnopilus junonius]